MTWLFNQYQVKTEAPTAFLSAVPQFESAWHQPWSEPVRYRITKGAAVALIASGLFAPVFSGIEPGPGYESTWHQPWSEPVRTKLALRTGDQSFLFTTLRPPLVSFAFYNWLTEPVRLKPGLGAALQQVDSLQTPIQPVVSRLIQWFAPLSQPVRLPIGLRAWLQQTTAMPPRLLPNPNVTGIWASTEINSDVALFGIQVYDSITPVGTATSANVSISEIKAEGDASASLSES